MIQCDRWPIQSGPDDGNVNSKANYIIRDWWGEHAWKYYVVLLLSGYWRKHGNRPVWIYNHRKMISYNDVFASGSNLTEGEDRFTARYACSARSLRTIVAAGWRRNNIQFIPTLLLIQIRPGVLNNSKICLLLHLADNLPDFGATAAHWEVSLNNLKYNFCLAIQLKLMSNHRCESFNDLMWTQNINCRRKPLALTKVK